MANRYGLTPAQAAIWGDIQASVEEHMTTAELWNEIRAAAERLGTRVPEGMFQAVNTMRNLSAQLRNASDRLTAASRDEALDRRYYADEVYLRDASNPLAGTSYHVRFTVPQYQGGETRMQTFTMLYEGSLPATVGDLMDDLDLYATELGNDYAGELGAIQSVEIGAF